MRETVQQVCEVEVITCLCLQSLKKYVWVVLPQEKHLLFTEQLAMPFWQNVICINYESANLNYPFYQVTL